jgi:brefeldin A-resistance guanine nucleotide exchange factor 1
MLLVMSNGGYLAPPDENPKREELWNETWKRINRFQPDLFGELFPEEAGKPRKEREIPVREKGKENEKVEEDNEKAEGVGEVEVGKEKVKTTEKEG